MNMIILNTSILHKLPDCQLTNLRKFHIYRKFFLYISVRWNALLALKKNLLLSECENKMIPMAYKNILYTGQALDI